MGSHEQPSLSVIGEEVRGWIVAAQAVLAARQQIINAADAQSAALTQRTVRARRNNRYLWHIIALRPDDRELLRAIACKRCLPPVPADVQRELQRLTTEVGRATQDLKAVTGVKRFVTFGENRQKGQRAAQFLTEYHQWFVAKGMRGMIDRAAPVDDRRVGALTLRDALADWVGLAPKLFERGATATVEDVTSFDGLPDAAAVIRQAAAQEAALRAAAVNAGNAVRNRETDRMLADMSVDRLREATRDKIRVGALIDNGITTVLAVLANEHGLEAFDGIGETSATRIRGAARTLRQNTFDEMPMRIDIKNRTPGHTEFLRCLRAWDTARRTSASPGDAALVDEMAPIAAVVGKPVTHAIVVPTALASVTDFREAVQTITRAAHAILNAQHSAQTGDPWDDFMSRPADYFALLAELGFITEDDEKTHGDLPTDIVEAVREFELKADHLTASLRGYQSFAARFALVQRKVIIGDEMGLGKTIEAIAVLAHLRAKGDHNFLVVCPAAVVTNWVREVAGKSKLTAHRLHGPDRHWAAKNWERNGGVAVTTFETLPWLKNNVSVPSLGCVVVDEAHYIKNPDALRTQRTAQLIDSCERAVLLTGTPLENRLEEFRNLVGYLRCGLTMDVNEFSPKKFRRQVAPAYLRRNQEDVLTELPELVEVDEWVPMSSEDSSAYRTAVDQRNFMAMRQAGMNQGLKSAKMQRLIEIVDEAEENGRRVVVFSHFLDVLKQIARHMPGRVFGPLTGSVPANQRQVMVDDFSAATKGAVLVAQIVAGGVGLNIQAASVVAICEPQLKPTTEWQAIARAHRMGQLESVQVHRLLSDEGVDQRIREIIAHKKEVFESFARKSETAESAPEAYDVTEAELAREVIAAERERLFGQTAPDVTGSGSTAETMVDDGPNTHEAPRPGPPAAQIPAGLTRAPYPEQSSAATNKTPTSPASVAPRTADDRYAHRPRRVTAPMREAATTSHTVPQATTTEHGGLEPYPAFNETLPSIAQTPPDRAIDNVVRIVAIEGPMTGWRIHQVYKKCSTVRESHDDFSRLLNRAISAAEKRQSIVSDNPSNQTGNKPRTFRLSSQPRAVARELGVRTIDIVPPAEVVQYCREASAGADLSDDELIQRVGKLLGIKQPATDLRNAVLAARTLDERSGASRNTVATPNPSIGSGRHVGSQMSNELCPNCFTVHAGECA